LYLRGKSGVYENTATSLRAAQEWLEQALKLDPGFGLACSRLAYATQIMTDNGYLSSTDGYERARSLAKRALEISPELVEPHMWLGYVYRVLDWNWEAAGEEFSLVLRDDPANPDVLMFSGTLSKTLGKWAEAERSLRAAIRGCPEFCVIGPYFPREGCHADQERDCRRAAEGR